MLVFSGLPLQGSAHGRNQEFEFGAALKRKAYLGLETDFQALGIINYFNSICTVKRKSLLGYNR